MKSINLGKRTVSLILAVIMVISMMTVGIVATSAATFSGTGRYVYFTSPDTGWNGNIKAYFYDSADVGTAWPGETTEFYQNNAYGQAIYKAEIAQGAKYVIFSNNGSSQTGSIEIAGTSGIYYLGADNKLVEDTTSSYPNAGYESTPATEAATETSTEGESGDTRTITIGVVSYIGDPQNVRIHYWGGTTDGDATPVSLSSTEQFTVDGTWSDAQTYNLYSVTIPADATKIKVHWASGTWDNDECDVADGKIYLIYNYDGNHLTPVDYAGGGETPTEGEPGETIRIYFYDNTSSGWINGSDANIFVRPSGSQQVVKMTETVDVTDGHKVWYADVGVSGRYYFYRCSYYCNTTNAQATAWNTWDATSRGNNITYKPYGSDTGNWSSNNPTIADPTDINNFTYGIWVDAKGAGNVLDAVSWYKKSDTAYDLYLPSYTNLNNVKMYTSFDSVTVNGTAITKDTPANVSLTAGSSYTVNGKTMTVYRSNSTAALMLTTNEDLWTGTLNDLNNSNAWPGDSEPDGGWVSAYKEAISTGGSYLMYNESGTQINTDTKLKKIKGRGNSSFKGSLEIYGKYAYNITTNGKEKLIDGCEKSKKWCLLANNVDLTMMRNTVIYGIADAIGVKYSPNTRLIDLFDNGNYLGTYVITEKVEYGKSTLMPDMVNMDDLNETIVNEAGELVDISKVSATTTTYRSGSTDYSCKYYDVTTAGGIEPAYQDANFLLEHELYDRYTAELSWFVSGRTGQAVVVKYPEYVTKGEMEWIIDKYEAMESAVYDNNSNYDGIDAAIDTTSFAKMYLIQELTNNLDSGATSFYIYNDLTSGKLCAAPVWDYDWSLGGYTDYKKFVMSGSSVVNSEDLANPEYMFVRNKALKTDGGDNTKIADYNLQAKLTKNSTYFELCQAIYTNQLCPQLFKYVKRSSSETGKIIDELLPKFESSMVMDNARWNSVNSTDTWGTKVTSDYTPWSYNFYIGDRTKSGTSSKSYSNAVYYLNDWLKKRTDAMSSSSIGNLYRSDLKYTISDAAFDTTQSGDQLTITNVTATAAKDTTALDASQLKYDVYLGGKVVASGITSTDTTDITLAEGSNSVYVVVYPADFVEVTSKSETKVIPYSDGVTYVNATIAFKSSSSYRYIPQVSVNGAESVSMTQGECIGHNASFTQKYYWYTANVTLVQNEINTLRFTNALSMSATVTVSVDAEPTGTLYFGANNLNNATKAVDLTSSNENVRNFVKSATCMVDNNPVMAGLATTSLGGTIYKLGDTDEDNSLTIMDVTKTQRQLAQLDTLTETGEALADYNLSGDVSISDCTYVQIYLANNP